MTTKELPISDDGETPMTDSVEPTPEPSVAEAAVLALPEGSDAGGQP